MRFQQRQLDPGSIRFNATTSVENLGTSPSQDVFAQTVMVHTYTAGAHQNDLGYACTKGGSIANNAVIFGTASNSVQFNGGSTTTGAPNAGLFSAFVLSAWQTFAATWDGGLLGSGINLYLGTNGSLLARLAGVTTTNGTGTVLSGSGNDLDIGNRTGGNRSWNGSIALVARWSRVLSLNELRQAQALGPQSVPTGLILCWYHGTDYGPFALKRVASTALSQSAVPTAFCPPVYVALSRGVRYIDQVVVAAEKVPYFPTPQIGPCLAQ